MKQISKEPVVMKTPEWDFQAFKKTVEQDKTLSPEQKKAMIDVARLRGCMKKEIQTTDEELHIIREWAVAELEKKFR